MFPSAAAASAAFAAPRRVEQEPLAGYTGFVVKPAVTLLALAFCGCLVTGGGTAPGAGAAGAPAPPGAGEPARGGPPPAPPEPAPAPQPEAAASAAAAPQPAAVPEPQPAPQPQQAAAPAIPSEATLRRLLPDAVKPYTPVPLAGRAVLLLQDINRDGTPEILAPVAALSGSSVKPEGLADYSSAFVEGRPTVPFFLLVLVYRASGLVVASRIELGERSVFGGLTVVPLTSSGSGPLALVASFYTRAGVEQEWLMFSGPSLRPLSRLGLKDTLASRPKVEDIDRNGVIDIVVQESGVEVGVGYETLLTWYRWNGTRFVEQAAINVVRNLNAFLARTREQLVSHDWPALVSHSFAADQLRYYRGQGLSDMQIIMRGLGLAPHYEHVRPEAALADIADVVLPQFQENPFSATDERGSYFLLAYRVVESTGASKVIETPLYMLRDPFGERQFFFRIR